MLPHGIIRSDISSEYALDYLAELFSYDLRQGQGIALVTEREVVEDDD